MASGSDANLVGTSWHLIGYRAEGAVTTALPAPASTLVLDVERLHGTTGVNSFTGTWSADGENLSFGPVAATMLAGVGPAADQDQAVLVALNQVAACRRDGEELVLLSADAGEVLRYEPLVAASLLDTEWVVTGYRVGDGVRSLVADSEVTLMFAEDGTVSGTTGCNRYHGSYVLDADELSIGPLATTRMMCAPELMEQEMAFLGSLPSAARPVVEGSNLRLADLDDATVVTARAR